MKDGKPMEEEQVARTSPLPSARPGPGRGMRLDRKGQELPLGGPSQRFGHPGIEEPHDGCKHAIRGERIAAMNSKHPLAEAEHYRAIGMGNHTIDFCEAKCM